MSLGKSTSVKLTLAGQVALLCYNRVMQTVQHLIDQFVPNNYKLSLVLNRQARTFDGTIAIYGESQPGFSDITVHSKNLDIKSVIMDGKKADFSYGENDALIITHPDIKY